GAVWSSCSPDFGATGVLDRFGQIEPAVLIATDGYRFNGQAIDTFERVEEITARLPSLRRVVVVPVMRTEETLAADVAFLPLFEAWGDWADMQGPVPPLPFERLPFGHPLVIMYSSGTTGLPKGMVHGAGGTLLQHLKELVLHTDLRRDDRIMYFTTCGWMMWNWVVSSLAVGATVVCYDGSPLLRRRPGVLWDLVQAERLTVLGTSAKWIALTEKAGIRPRETHDLGALRCILSTGSPLAPAGFDYVYRDVKADVHLASISGGTDIISCFALGVPTEPVYRGELQGRGLGMAVEVWEADGTPVVGNAGELVCTRPFPSMPVSFWNDPDGARYRAAYFDQFPGVWRHGDWAELTPRGGMIIHGRSDATLNPAGVRIGTAEIYRQVEQLPEVMESVAVGQATGIGDVRVVLFVRLRDGITLDNPLRDRIRHRIREFASPHHVPKKVIQVADIPRTISGKISEIAVRETIHGRPVANTEALANPDSLALYRDLPALREGA
nr:acetoacetate--CoA ligase [Gemmatimonadaceae bacterium]